MIEVEIKFKSSPENNLKLIEGATFIDEKVIEDTYYDKSNFELTTKNQWLRSRNSKFEFKIPPDPKKQTIAEHYLEIENDSEIKAKLEINSETDLETGLRTKGYNPFCTCKTIRKTYQKEGFTIVLDQVDYGDFSYQIAEIELMLEESQDLDLATQKIRDFAKSIGLDQAPTRGKVLEYLYQVKPDHFQALVEAGVVNL